MADDALSALPDGFSLDPHPAVEALPEGFSIDRQPFSTPMGSATGFLKTAAVRAGGSLVDLATQGPQGMLRQLFFPDIAEAEKNIDPMSAPGSVLADKTLEATGGAYQPENAGQRLALSATTGALAGGPFGVAGAALGGASGALGQGAAEVGLPRWAQVAAGFAPALAGKPAEMMTRSPETKGLSVIGKRFAIDEAAGGPSAATVSARLADANGKPLAIADAAGEAVKGLGEGIATQPGQGRTIATQFLNPRDEGAGPRLVADSAAVLNPSGDTAFGTAEQLRASRAAAAQPAYNAFYEAPPIKPGSLAEDHLSQLMSRPSMRSAAQRALTIAQEEGRDPMSLGIRIAEDGTPSFERVPSWQTMDYLKRGIDDVLEPYRNPITGRLQLDEHGRAINATQRDLINFMDQETRRPDGTSLYANARAAYSGPSQSLDAMRRGSNIFNLSPEQIAEDVRTLSPGDVAFYRQGAQDAMRKQINNTSLGGNEALRVMGNQTTRDRIQALFPRQADYQAFMKNAWNESLMAKTRQETLGNSRSARRLGEMVNQEQGGALGSAIQIAGGFAAGEPIAGVLGIPKLAKAIGERVTRPSPEVDAAIARILYNSDLGANQSALARIMQGLPQGNSYLGPSLLGAPQGGLLGNPNARR